MSGRRPGRRAGVHLVVEIMVVMMKKREDPAIASETVLHLGECDLNEGKHISVLLGVSG